MELLDLRHILVARTDRIGDVLLTFPAVEALKSNFKGVRVTMLVSPYTAQLVEGSAGVLLYNKEKPFFEMLTELRHARIDAAVAAYPRFRIALLIWLAGIPIRVGTGFRWYSFLFNRRVYEHRKAVEKHESEYNLSLVKELGCRVPEKPEVHLDIPEYAKKAAAGVRKALAVSDGSKLVLLHPGSGGSAREWKSERFAQLAALLIKKGFEVIITGGVNEKELVEKTTSDAGPGVKSFISILNLMEFAALIQTAQLFIANSTGPLHIAASVGTPVIGLYPPVRVMSPKRWGPLIDKKAIFVPDPSQCLRCKGGECQGSDCMDQILVSRVLDAAIGLIKGN